jgi:hypothetical protein
MIERFRQALGFLGDDMNAFLAQCPKGGCSLNPLRARPMAMPQIAHDEDHGTAGESLPPRASNPQPKVGKPPRL